MSKEKLEKPAYVYQTIMVMVTVRTPTLVGT